MTYEEFRPRAEDNIGEIGKLIDELAVRISNVESAAKNCAIYSVLSLIDAKMDKLRKLSS